MAVLLSTVIEFFKEEPKLVDRGRNAQDSGHTERCVLNDKPGEPGCVIRALIHASMKNKCYNVEICVENHVVTKATCECPRGQVRCHHMATAMLVAMEKFSKTDVACTWSKPKGSKKAQETQTVEEMWPPSTEPGCVLGRLPTKEDYQWLHDEMKALHPDLGIVWLLSEEPPKDQHCYSMEYIVERFRGARLEVFLDKMRLTKEAVLEIARLTSDQGKSPLWMLHRQLRITASNFGLVLSAIARNRFCPSLYKTLLGGYAGATGAAISWGRNNEKTAIASYEERQGVHVQKTGIWLSEDGILGSSPDGLVDDDGLVEVKCPYTHRDSTIEEAIATDKKFCLQQEMGEGPTLKKSHNYYHQVQGQIHLCNRSWCDFVVWTTKSTTVIRILKDAEWVENLQRLKDFYISNLIPKFK